MADPCGGSLRQIYEAIQALNTCRTATAHAQALPGGGGSSLGVRFGLAYSSTAGRGSRPPTVYKCETTFARLPLRGIPIYTLRIYVSRTHVCYNRYPPHVDSNILYSSQLLALLSGCVCLRHSRTYFCIFANICSIQATKKMVLW